VTSPPDDDWFADESFWQSTFPFMFPDSRIAAAEQEVEQLLALAQCGGDGAGRKALDLACGPGRHAVALASRGFAVTGVDRSDFLLGHARERASRAGQNVEWVREDMRAFVRPSTYDLAISLFTSFGFFRDDGDNAKVLENVAASLKPGGAFVLDLLGKERLARIFTATNSRDLPNGVIVHRHRIVDDWCRVSNEWILIEGEASKTFRFSHWLYSARELRDMLVRAGFGDVRVYGDLGGSPYGVDAARLVVVGYR
jgi:SAM-dependent methyltransferase